MVLNIPYNTIDYEFNSVVTFENGKKSSFRKIEHIKISKDKSSYLFRMLGSSEETLNGDAPEEWDAIVLQFGKALYPFDLKVNGQGVLEGVNDFDGIKEHWFAQRQQIIDFYNSYLIEKESNNYALALKSEEKFFNIIQKNMFYRLLFWQEDLPSQEVEIRDFPARTRLAIFTFQKGKVENGALCYETSWVNDEGSGHLLSGKCMLRIRRDMDGLPAEISLVARVEEQDTGYFTKEIMIRRL